MDLTEICGQLSIDFAAPRLTFTFLIPMISLLRQHRFQAKNPRTCYRWFSVVSNSLLLLPLCGMEPNRPGLMGMAGRDNSFATMSDADWQRYRQTFWRMIETDHPLHLNPKISHWGISYCCGAAWGYFCVGAEQPSH